MQPDESTKKRFELLARVGNALFLINNETRESTEYFLAKTALNEFEEEVTKLNLDPQTMEGIKKLIEYLNKKLQKRITQSQNT